MNISTMVCGLFSVRIFCWRSH